MKVAIVSGGFDPVHSGHLQAFESAKRMADKLIVALNSDAWLTRKKGQPFMPASERMALISNLKMVDHAILFDDIDGSARKAIEMSRAMYPEAKLLFCNGGDRTKDNIPEMSVQDDNLDFIFGVGGSNKANSSSWLLNEWKSPKTMRPWGYYRVLHEIPGTKVKELIVEPGQRLSIQRHFLRSEIWCVSEGEGAVIRSSNEEFGNGMMISIKKHDVMNIGRREWHQLVNNGNRPLHLVEIQYGDLCEEADIERKEK